MLAKTQWIVHEIDGVNRLVVLHQARRLHTGNGVDGPLAHPVWTLMLRSSQGLADAKCMRKSYAAMLTRAGVDLMLVVLLMRHTTPAGAGLTFGIYADPDALLARKRTAVVKAALWYLTQIQLAKKCSASAAQVS